MTDRDTEIGGLRVARWLVWFVYAVIVAVEIILAIAFFLLLLGANPAAPFAEWIYRSTERIMEPFRGIFGTVSPDGNESVLDLSLLFAMFIYGIAAILIDGLVRWIDTKVAELKAKQRDERLRAERNPYDRPGTTPPDQA
ncbi:MAG: YggT family protein [Acidimicrobiia bacterium]|nr:YggT family protein [Acidimicrobiia bacterium]